MSNYLPTDYQAFIHKSRYAKYFDGKGVSHGVKQ